MDSCLAPFLVAFRYQKMELVRYTFHSFLSDFIDAHAFHYLVF